MLLAASGPGLGGSGRDLANVQFLRTGQFLVIIATRGHRFFDKEGQCVKDICGESIHFPGYSISYRPGCDRKAMLRSAFIRRNTAS